MRWPQPLPPRGTSPGEGVNCDYGSEEHAVVVYKTLAVDKELQPDKVRREMTVSGGKLLVHFEAVEARFLRASFSAFVDLMVLVTKLVEEYGGVSQALMMDDGAIYLVTPSISADALFIVKPEAILGQHK